MPVNLVNGKHPPLSIESTVDRYLKGELSEEEYAKAIAVETARRLEVFTVSEPEQAKKHRKRRFFRLHSRARS